MEKYKLLDIKPLHDNKLLLTYEGEEPRVFDVTPYIKGNWYGELRDEKIFRSVRVDYNTAVWCNGQDLAPHELYEYSVKAKNNKET